METPRRLKSVDEHSDNGPNPTDGTGEDQVDVDGCLREAIEPELLNDCKQLNIKCKAIY